MITDREVEGLGFKFLGIEEGKRKFINISKNNRDEQIYFGRENYVAIENNCGDFYFMGWLKSIEELKKLLNQVGVYYSIINL
jgi:hypothetical protein